MRAIILGAGEGKRLRPLTNDIPKCMVKYQNKAILSYQICAMRELGVTDINIVAGYKSHIIQQLGFNTIINSSYSTTNMVYSLFCAESLFDQDIIISYGDIVYGHNILKKVIEDTGEISVAISMNWLDLWKRRMENPLEDAETLKLDDEGYIKELGNKPRSYDEIEGQYMGLLKIEKSALKNQVIEHYSTQEKKSKESSEFKNMFMTTFLQDLINDGIKLSPVKIYDDWLEIDDPNDLNINIEI